MTALVQAAIIGGGVIGAGWAARLVANGVNVCIYDPAPTAAAQIQHVLSQSRRASARLYQIPLPTEGQVVFAGSVATAVQDAQLIIESVPERVAVKQAVYAEIEAAAKPDAIIASSTSGILPSELQSAMTLPGRFLVAHPFNPVYLLPLVELVAGKSTDPATIARAEALYTGLGMKALIVKKEIAAFIADRLLEAVWREALWLVKDGIATTEDVDDAVRFGFGLRYAQMGIFDTYRVAGGAAGMRHFMAQFGPCLQWPWSRLTDVPEFDDELVELIASQSDAQSGHLSIAELEQIRDDNLVAILRALKDNAWGAGQTLADYEQRLSAVRQDR
jgi:carnitine 3-dehydrogenase